jgi:hypothetical protein
MRRVNNFKILALTKEKKTVVAGHCGKFPSPAICYTVCSNLKCIG